MNQENVAKKIKNVAVAVVKDNSGKVLIIKRNANEVGIDGGYVSWVFPGGTVQASETPLQTAARETLEETGYSVVPVSKISERTHHVYGVHLTYAQCALEGKSPVDPTEKEKVQAVAWVSPSELNKYFTTDIDLNVAKFLGLHII
jgi:8-oxo-dGTP pyrophosphatase MutT (NUDIX family)